MVGLLVAALLAPQGPSPQGPFRVEPVRVDDGPTVLVHRQASPLVSLRLSVPVPEPLMGGSVELLQELARPEAEAAARRIGARIELRVDGARAVIAATGPATAFDGLAAILRRAVSEPDLSVTALRSARARAEGRVLAGLEQPAPRVRGLLRHGLYGGPEPVGAAGVRLTPEAVREARRRLYDARVARVVLVGSVPDLVIRSAFARWPAAGGGGAVAPVDAGEPARPQAHREWGGLGFPVEAEPAVLAVVAALVQERVDRSALRYGVVEAWLEPTPALVLIGAAVPGDSVVRASAGISGLEVAGGEEIPGTDVRRYLRRLVAEAAALTGPDAVARARTAARRALLVEARTVAGKAEVIGRVADGIDPDGRVADYLQRLAAVELADVREVLSRVLDTAAVTAEAR